MSRLLSLACWLTLFGLGLFVWSVLHPHPVPVMVAMSVGQVSGTVASAIFLYAVLSDLK